MIKTKQKYILALVGLLVLMTTAASVSANEDDEPKILDRADIEINEFDENGIIDTTSIGETPNLISPSPETDGEPLVISPGGVIENEDSSSQDNAFTTGIVIAIGVLGFASLSVVLIILKKKD
jgi:hypothetical protein